MQGRGFSALAQICNRSRLGTPRLPRLICNLVLFCAAAAIAAPAQSVFFTTLVSFGAPQQPFQSDGAQPYAGLVQATDGNFYGTTLAGGTSENCLGGCGTVFKITPGGTLTRLYSFCAQSGCPDGYKPYAGLVQATDGNFYGTTYGGGAYGNCVGGLVGCGTVFKITPAGALTTLYSFCAQGGCADGYTPFGGLVQATDGNLYGTTTNGGDGAGTVFKITPSGTLTTLLVFDYSDGDVPLDALVQATDGNFYGTTHNGGGYYLLGNVFKMTPAGEVTTLYTFCSQGGGNCTDGRNPGAALVQASDRNFYGTTNGGGVNNNCEYGCGTVFKITSGGELTTLHSFNGADGQPPYAALVQATDGNFYGTTAGGGYGYGTVFEMTPAGEVITLYSFCSQGGNCPDGAGPTGGLVQARDGNFYGTTTYGGTYDGGTVFRLGVVNPCPTCRP